MWIRGKASQPTSSTGHRLVRQIADSSATSEPLRTASLGVARALFVLALVGVVAGQATLVFGRDGSVPLLLYFVGGACGVASAVVAARLPRLPEWADDRVLNPSRLAAASAIVPLAAATCGLATLAGPIEHILALVLWLATLAAALVIAARLDLASSGTTPNGVFEILRRVVRSRELVGVVALIAIGAFLRIIGLASIPGGVHGDETGEALISLTILAGRGPSPFGTAFLGDRAMHFWVQAPFIAALGPSIAGMRAFTVLCGITTLPAFYLLVRVVLGVRPAFIALILLATSGLHIHFSRLALNVEQIPLLYCLAVTAFFLGRRAQYPFWWLLSGVVAGLAVYASFGGLLVLPLIGLLFVGLAMEWRRHFSDWLRAVAYASFGVLLVLGPMWAYQLGRHDNYGQHIASRFIFSPGSMQHVLGAYGTSDAMSIILQQGRRVLLFCLSQGDGGPFTGFIGMPLLPVLIAPFSVLGTLLLAMRVKNLVNTGVVPWFASVFLAGVLTIDAPQAHRLLPALLPLLVAAAYALDWAIGIAGRLFGPSVREGAIVCAFALTLLGGGYDAARYFAVTSAVTPWESATRIAQFFGSVEPDHRGLLLGAPNYYYDHSNVRFFAPRLKGGDLPNPGGSLPLPLPDGTGYAIAVSEDMRDYAALVHHFYPTARIIEHAAARNPGSNLFRSVVVPRDALGMRPGLVADYGSNSRNESDLGGLGGGARSYPTDVRWHGSVYVDRPGDYFVGASDPNARIALDGIEVTEAKRTPLAGGWHSISVGARLEDERMRLALRWRSADQQMKVIPADLTDNRQLAGDLRYRLIDQEGRVLVGSSPTIGFRILSEMFRVSLPAQATWYGSLLVDCPGEHTFLLTADGRAQLSLDGVEVVRTQNRSGVQSVETKPVLRAGEHRFGLVYDWQQGGGWTEVSMATPCSPRSAIAPDRFVPLGAGR